jgi:hypothetical protein
MHACAGYLSEYQGANTENPIGMSGTHATSNNNLLAGSTNYTFKAILEGNLPVSWEL